MSKKKSAKSKQRVNRKKKAEEVFSLPRLISKRLLAMETLHLEEVQEAVASLKLKKLDKIVFNAVMEGIPARSVARQLETNVTLVSRVLDRASSEIVSKVLASRRSKGISLEQIPSRIATRLARFKVYTTEDLDAVILAASEDEEYSDNPKAVRKAKKFLAVLEEEVGEPILWAKLTGVAVTDAEAVELTKFIAKKYGKSGPDLKHQSLMDIITEFINSHFTPRKRKSSRRAAVATAEPVPA